VVAVGSWLLLTAACGRGPGDAAGADACAAAAERLASLRLGNYATMEARQPVVAELTERCLQERPSKADLACLHEAGGRAAVARCPKPLLPELAGGDAGCAATATSLADLLFRALAEVNRRWTRPDFAGIEDVFLQACVEDRWSAALQTCAAQTTEAMELERCFEQESATAWKALEDRMRPAVDALVRRP
jgi:hypothetical protein